MGMLAEGLAVTRAGLARPGILRTVGDQVAGLQTGGRTRPAGGCYGDEAECIDAAFASLKGNLYQRCTRTGSPTTSTNRKRFIASLQTKRYSGTLNLSLCVTPGYAERSGSTCVELHVVFLRVTNSTVQPVSVDCDFLDRFICKHLRRCNLKLCGLALVQKPGGLQGQQAAGIGLDAHIRQGM